MRKLVLIVAVCAACSSSVATSTTTPPPPPPSPAGTVIGAAGGTVTSADGHAVLTFPPGALPNSVSITTEAMTDAPASSELVASRAYNFGPSGTQFNQPVTITLSYDPAQLPNGLMPTFLRLYLRDGAGWDSIPGSTVDTVAHTVTGTTTHFSGFTPCGPSCSFINGPPTVALQFVPNCCAVINQGGSASVVGAVNVTAYGGGVGLTFKNPPPGVTMSYAFGPQVGSSCLVVCGMPVTVTFTTTTATPLGRVNFDVEVVPVSGVSTGVDFPVPAEILPVPAIAISLSSTSLFLSQSTTATNTATLTRTNFTAPVTLTAVNLPSGVTASFDPAQLTGTVTTSILTLTGSSTALAGTSNITIRATAAGLTNVDDVIPLTVSSFAISGTPAAVSLTPGTTGNTGVKVTRGNGFSGTITYAVSGLPAGLTASVTPTSVADSSQLSLTASASLTPGSYPIVVTATSGAIVQQVTIAVTVAASGSNGVRLDWSTCQFRPLWVAYQDGNGAWTRVTGSGDVYTLPAINSATAGLAFVLPNPFGGFGTVTNFLTKAELSVLPVPCASISMTSANVTVSGIPDTLSDIAWLSLGAAGNSTTKPGTISIGNVSPGTHDLVGYLQAPTGDRVTIQRGANGGNIDFSSASTPANAMMTVNGNSGTLMSTEMFYITQACEAGVMYVTNPSVSPFQFTGMPAALQAASDVHAFQINDFGASSYRSVTTYFHAVANMSVTLGAVIAPTVSALAGPYKRVQAVFALPSDYGYVHLQLTSATSPLVSLVSQTGGYIGTGNVTIAVPDFSAVAGFNTSWELQASDAPGYHLEANAVSPFSAPTCVAGTTSKLTYVTGTP
jgi:hypothetical protein